ncbi:hypothetical protein [Streptomyces sp. SH5]|uniref:hypothetical protein n=1 Tax=Streptomyces sp. SH5 TaxID=3041765 RepID=UPI002477D921|nr:hypothetical protein [Streptomyces sp. SH5]WGP08454.1 hypothetical protein QFA72_01570 [Streptomyces sp. SH5]
MTLKSGRRLAAVAALLTTVGLASACGDGTEPADAAQSPGNATSTAAGKPAQRTEPLTAAELKPALLTADQVAGFEITGSSARDGADEEAFNDAVETVSPEACRPVRDATKGDGEETAAAHSTMYRGKSALAPRSTNLLSYREEAARARMTLLREALGTCDRFSFSTAFGKASVTSEVLDAPDLGDDTLRYRTLSRLDEGGFAWKLVTAVRVGGVIATMDVQEVTGPLPPEELATFKPEPGPDEGVIARLVENVTEAQGV